MIRENDDMATVRVGLLGCGNVGAPLTQLLDDNADLIARRAGVRLEVTRVAVHNLAKERDVTFAEGVLTNDAQSVVDDPDVDIVVEIIGGVEPARSLLLSALKAGKPVVTANKELLANFGEELFEAARDVGCRPAVRGVGRGRHPVDAPAARVARGRTHPPRHGDRERHDELHPHADERRGLDVR